MLEALGGLSGKLAAARAAVLARFDAARGHDGDGYGSSAAWLAAKGRTTRKAANAEVRRMRQFRAHPVVAAAVARGELSQEWAASIADWTRKLPPDWRQEIDKLLVDTAWAGADLADLAIVAQAAYEKWRQQQGPDDDDDDGYDDRYLKLATTLDGVGRINGNLTGECAAAVQAVLEALGKKAGPEDDRTEAQRFHDALQQACELLLQARLVPDRAGASTRADVVVALSQLRSMPGAAEVERAYLAALAGEHACLSGTDAQAAACDAVTVPVVTGHPDLAVVDKMIGIVLAYLDATEDGHAGHGSPGAAGGGSHRPGRPGRRRPRYGRHRRRRAGHHRAGHRHRPVPGAVAGGVAGPAVRDRPAGHRPGLRTRRHRLHLAPRPARRAVQQQVRHLGRRRQRQHPRPHPPRRPAPRPRPLRMARLHQAGRVLRRAPPAPPARRRQHLPIELRPFVPIPP